MLNNKNTRAVSNLAMLEFVARKLGKLNEEVVFFWAVVQPHYLLPIPYR